MSNKLKQFIMNTIYHTEFTRKGYGQWDICIQFENGAIMHEYTTDSKLFDEWNDLESQDDKNELIEDRFDYKIEDFFNQFETE